MIVISDTTPLISFLKINRIDLLEKLFGDVLIPQAVFEELTIDERFQLEADQIRQKKFIVVKPVNNPESANSIIYSCFNWLTWVIRWFIKEIKISSLSLLNKMNMQIIRLYTLYGRGKLRNQIRKVCYPQKQ